MQADQLKSSFVWLPVCFIVFHLRRVAVLQLSARAREINKTHQSKSGSLSEHP